MSQKLKELDSHCEIIVNDKLKPSILIPISLETKVTLDKVGAKLSKKNSSYNEIIQYLISLSDYSRE